LSTLKGSKSGRREEEEEGEVRLGELRKDASVSGLSAVEEEVEEEGSSAKIHAVLDARASSNSSERR